MEFSSQEYYSGLPFSSPGDLPDPGTEPGSPAQQVDSLTSEPPMASSQQQLCKLHVHLLAYRCTLCSTLWMSSGPWSKSVMRYLFRNAWKREFVVAPWLGLGDLTARACIPPLVRELGSHRLHGRAKKQKCTEETYNLKIIGDFTTACWPTY